ncbi:MAG: hypothetical protein L3K15_06330 [Thermoplasmata archaeon]|nr:hypothetical protein [Thermoplasmata archaeon]
MLQTPAGFETRPIPSIHPLGFAVLSGIFLTVALNIGALLLLSRRPRISARLVAVGFVLVVLGIFIDQAGWFSVYPPPGRISVVEATFVLVELVALILAILVYRATPARAPASS